MGTINNQQLLFLLEKELYRKSLYEFVKGFWNTTDPAKFVDGVLIEYYCELFQYMCRVWVGYEEPVLQQKLPLKTDDIEIIDVRKQDKHNLCLMVPPRHTKSKIFNVFGPTWLWLTAPIKAVSISHTEGLASKMNTERKNIINSEKFQYYFENDVILSANTNTFIRDMRGGELYSLNRNAMTGYGGDVIINDDLTNAAVARKDKEEMNNAWAYYRDTMPSRINDINKCIIMNIQQRLAPNDIAGHIMNDPKLRGNYIFVTLPAIFSKDTYLVFPISGKVVKFKKGDALWPERFGDYSSLRLEVGEDIFQTQYLQNPISSDRTIIKHDVIVEKDAVDVPSIDFADNIYASHDFPVKDKETSDFLGSVLGYRVGSTLYLIDCLEEHQSYTKSVNYVRSLDERYPGIIQIIEDKANGSPILQQLQEEVPGLQAFQPGTASKAQRLESASLYINNIVFVRNVLDKMTKKYLLSDNLSNLKKRIGDYPFVEHDDIVDAFSMLALFVFMDKRYAVYGRSFNDANIVDANQYAYKLHTPFVNKEGDIWKVLDIAVIYGVPSKIIVLKEVMFKATIKDGMKKLKEFAPNKNAFVDCSFNEGLNGLYDKENNVTMVPYSVEGFDKSVGNLNVAFSSKLVLIDKNCRLLKGDIENFKYSKTKDENNMKYRTEKDGFVACLRVALRYYGIYSY